MVGRSAIIHMTYVKAKGSHIQVFYKGIYESDLIVIIYGSIKGNRKKGGLKAVLSLYEFHDLKIKILAQKCRRFLDSLTARLACVGIKMLREPRALDTF